MNYTHLIREERYQIWILLKAGDRTPRSGPLPMWEIRSTIDQRIARILFTVIEDKMVLLHGFIKKSQKTPKAGIELARARKAKLDR